MFNFIKDSFTRDDLVRSLYIIWILVGICISFIICICLDATHGLEISKNTKINVNNIKDIELILKGIIGILKWNYM